MVSNKKPFSCFPVVIIQYPLKSYISLVAIPSSWLARNGKASYSLPAVYFWEKFNPRWLKRELSAHVCKIKPTPAQATSECAAIWKQEISAEFSRKKWRISRDVLYVARVSSKQSIFFSVRTETSRNSICCGCFSDCFAKPKTFLFRFVSFCFGVSDRYRNNRNKAKNL